MCLLFSVKIRKTRHFQYLNLIFQMEKMQGCSLTAHFGRQRGQVLIVFVTISNSIKSFVLILHTAYFDAGRAREGPRAS